MKKVLFLLCFILLFSNIQQDVQAIEQVSDLSQAEVTTTSEEELSTFIKNVELYQNNKNFSTLQKIYADEFVNTDGFNKAQLFSLIKKTFSNYPNLKTSFDIKKIITSGNYAMVFVEQNANATTKNSSKITGDNGNYQAQIHSILYLKKINKIWKIYSEAIISESSVLAFGTAKNISAQIIAPQKVVAGTDYCAGINVNIPTGFSAIASINNTEIKEKSDNETETFRQVSLNEGSLERMLKANTLNNNEAIIASVAFTKQTEDMFKKPKIDISGLLVLMKRVDIIAQNSNIHTTNETVPTVQK